ncbi:uncharacterized protein LOC128962565 [Oppia nitens]|uniref:uncharacterized protein LOC128962565 n=1 Tax=Oppia nitens TaxID=1686743 RepID=UPI0023DC637F|nr:uncharacterized protein LOC128962565 [Oppia nitens]
MTVQQLLNGRKLLLLTLITVSTLVAITTTGAYGYRLKRDADEAETTTEAAAGGDSTADGGAGGATESDDQVVGEMKLSDITPKYPEKIDKILKESASVQKTIL